VRRLAPFSFYDDWPTESRTELQKAPKSALILGATGRTGRHLLRELIASSDFTRICEAGRRVTPDEDLPAEGQGREKLEQKVIDFERLDDAGLNEGQWDVVFITCVCSFLLSSQTRSAQATGPTIVFFVVPVL
jgi:N-acetyl-gamma-glutamylphosphate reductase